jgi:hypothetical protein
MKSCPHILAQWELSGPIALPIPAPGLSVRLENERPRRPFPMTELDKFQIMQIITNIVQKHGCELLELDIDNQIINIDGPEEARIACAMEIEAALE